jgi:cell shape-determining protein MreC
MMMILNRPSALASRSRRNYLLALGALVLLVGAAALWRAPLAGALWYALSPFMQARYGGDSVGAALASTTAVLADRDALYQENLDLKARLGRPGVSPVRTLGAVLMRPPGSPYDTLVIDVGESEGVATGDFASAGGTALIGSVSEVYQHTARIKLFSAPGERYDALLRLSGGGVVPLSIEGQGGGSMTAQAPLGTAVAVGDTALMPGIAGGVVATVSGVEKKEDSFVTVYFQLSANIFMLRFVEVWKETP